MVPSSRDGILGAPTSPRPSPTRHRGANPGRIALHVFRARHPQNRPRPLRTCSGVPPQDYYEAAKSPPATPCVGGPAWSKAQGSGSCPVGVRRFKSCPTHQVKRHGGCFKIAPRIAGSWLPLGVGLPLDSMNEASGRIPLIPEVQNWTFEWKRAGRTEGPSWLPMDRLVPPPYELHLRRP